MPIHISRTYFRTSVAYYWFQEYIPAAEFGDPGLSHISPAAFLPIKFDDSSDHLLVSRGDEQLVVLGQGKQAHSCVMDSRSCLLAIESRRGVKEEEEEEEETNGERNDARDPISSSGGTLRTCTQKNRGAQSER